MSATVAPLAEPSAPPETTERAVTAAASATSSFDSDVVAALRNATKLGLSLVAMWGVQLVIRVFLPRWLGPELFGSFQFADAFTSGLFVLAGLGVETYIRKEVSTRREHAGDFVAGLVVVRVILGVLLIGAALVGLTIAGRPPVVLRLVFLLALTQLFVVNNATLGALLHAVGEVHGLSVLGVVSKILWGGGALVGLLAGGGVVSVGAAMLASEVVKGVGLQVLVRRHVRVRSRVNVRATLAVLTASVPFFVASLSQALMGRINVTLVSFRASDLELGWYGAAASLAGIGMLLEPLLGWVLLPLSARAESRSPDEFTRLTRRSMRLVLTASVPIALFMGLWADVIVRVLFGAKFAPATDSLRATAPCFVLGYVSIVSCTALIPLGRGWTVTAVSVSSLVISVTLNWFLIPAGHALFGAGGAGIGAGVALTLNEVFSAGALTLALGGRAFDRSGLAMLAKMLIVCAVVAALDRLVLLPYGVARLPVDAAVYGALALLWRAGDYDVLANVASRILSRRRSSHAVAVV
ncbi:polysaccharide biosynthesis protein [Gemmatirosa kalamazoonensis]|uniref:Polysaccharide biosynthesis protein n=1 Tax=Gemmatirosa kalamazoonensis TaxID=861299 RepID=W0RBJ8_9BACT|nr:oligosaccharide flippase family protein [Gemmatirosa kalamazoonensis]AHG87675.1 polysaccharide biosynthesis protein [Gemmatirosa kalamazoonensis]